jgi:hypothetical protein
VPPADDQLGSRGDEELHVGARLDPGTAAGQGHPVPLFVTFLVVAERAVLPHVEVVVEFWPIEGTTTRSSG